MPELQTFPHKRKRRGFPSYWGNQRILRNGRKGVIHLKKGGISIFEEERREKDVLSNKGKRSPLGGKPYPPEKN